MGVSQFSAGSNATLFVKGDTVSGCKLVLLDRERNKTCCYSAPVREETMCDPGVQSEGCRGKESVKVEEHPGYCTFTFSNITEEDAGPYLVIFPGRAKDNERVEVKVDENNSENRLLSELPQVSDILQYEEVLDFLPGKTATMSVQGVAGSGCKFLLLNQARNFTCCFSAAARGDTLCNPDTQSSACRNKDRYRVDELPDTCLLTLPDIDNNDAGPYEVIFPGRLLDNYKFDVTLKMIAWDLGLITGSIATVIAVVGCLAIGFLCYSKNSRCHPAMSYPEQNVQLVS